MDNILNEVNTILNNAKKAGIKGYKQDTIREKLERLDTLENKVSSEIDLAISSSDIQKLGEQKSLINELIVKTKEYLQNLMVSLSSDEMDFNIESVLKTIPDFSGKYKELDKFLTII